MPDFDPTVSEKYRALKITFSALLTEDPALRACLDRARAAAESDLTVLLLGENGTGKNLVAQAIHNASRRVGGPYVALNCSALTETLLESELFGHEKGAFTGAAGDKRGRFELADGGTLFLDEIGDMSPAAQAKILRAVEYRQFERVGGERSLSADVRIIAASNQPLAALVAARQFRQDLYYRLNEVTITLPPLRRRKGDLPLLVEKFLVELARKARRRCEGLTDEAWALLCAHDWPGNVRELRACLKRGLSVAAGPRLTAADLALVPQQVPDAEAPPAANERPPSAPGGADPSIGSGPGPADQSLAAVEARHIRQVLAQTGGNKSEAARLLGISRPTLDRKIKAYGLAESSDRGA